MHETLIVSLKNSFTNSFNYIDSLDDTSRAIIYSLFLLLVILPFVWLIAKNFGKILVFSLGTIGILILVGFAIFWLSLFTN